MVKKWFSESRVYWATQIGCWVAYNALLWVAVIDGITWGSWFRLVFSISVSCIIGTNFYHKALIINEIDLSNWKKIAPYLFGCVFITATFISFFSMLVPLGLNRLDAPFHLETSINFLFLILFYSVFFLSPWFLSYHVIRYYLSLGKKELELERVTNLQRVAEMNNLKAQLNPHFLFNALNSIRALTLAEPHRAREMVSLLADLLRVALQVNKHNLIRVQEELDVVADYIALEKMRFEERLQIVLCIEEQVKELLIPTFSIQLLVENAIKHGLEKRENATHILIEIRLKNQKLIIQVSNAGIFQPGEKSGTGLLNLQQRLAMIYHGGADFRILQQTPEEVLAQIDIPLR